MTREKAKELLPIITAYAEGKAIQYFNGIEWRDQPFPSFHTANQWRIKPTPKLVPLTSADLPPVVWIKKENHPWMYLITSINTNNGGLNYGPGNIPILPECFNKWKWSPDRKTWNSFMKEVEE